MSYLVLGLFLFVAVHTVPMLPRLRARLIVMLGENGWRGIHTLVSLVGLALIVWGFGRARFEGAPLWWEMPRGLRHPMLLILLPVFPLIFASFKPGWIAARVGHPMVTGVALWAFGHLLVAGSAPAVTLFAVFFVWALAARLSLAKRRPRPVFAPPFGLGDVVAIALGIAAWAGMVWWGHLHLIGVAPLG